MELGNLSIKLGIDSTVKQQLDAAQKEIDAFLEKNKKPAVDAIIKAKIDKQDIKDQIEKGISGSKLGTLTATSVNLDAIKKQIQEKTFDIKVSPVLKFRKKQGENGEDVESVKIPAVVDKDYLIKSIHKALEGTKFTLKVGVGDKGFNTDNARTYQSQLSGIETTLTRMRRLLLSIYTVASSASILTNIIEIGGALQQQDVALKTLLGSERKQLLLSKQVTEMALKSPLSLQQTYAGVKQLAAYGIQYEDLAKTIKNLGNIAAGTGVSLDRLTLAYGQVAARGILQGQELRQFTEAGVNLPTALADYYSKLEGKMVTVADVQDRISRRMVSFQDVSNVINDMAGGTGRFADQMEKQADTMLGVWSNLGDKIQLMYKGILETNDGTFRILLESVTALIEAWRIWVPLLKGGLEVFLAYKILSSLPALFLSIRSALIGLGGSLVGIFQGSKAFTSGMKESASALRGMGASAKFANIAVKGLAALNIAAIIAGIATAIWELYRARRAELTEIEKVTDESQRHKNQQEQLKQTTTELTGKFTSLSEQYKAIGKNMKAQKQFIEDNQTAFATLGLRINDVNDANRILIERAPDVIKALTLMSQARVMSKMLDEASSARIKAHGKFIEYKAIVGKIENGQPLSDEEKNMINTLPWGGAQVDAGYLSPIQLKWANARVKNEKDRGSTYIASANMYLWRNKSRESLATMNEAAKEQAEFLKSYNAIMDPLNGKAEELSNWLPGNGNGKGNKSGNNKGEDVKLKALKEWFDREKDFLSTYEKLAELYGKEDALRRTIEAYGNPFIEVDEKGNAKRDKAGKYISANLTTENLDRVAQKNTQYRYDYWDKKSLGTTPERRSTMRDLNKFANEELQIKIDTTEFEAQSEKVSKWLDKLTKQYEEFRAIAEKTGDENLASRLVFNVDGVTQAKEYYDIISKLSAITKSLNLNVTVPDLMNMSDAELEDKYQGKGQYESMRNLVKRLKEINEERVRDENDTLAELLSSNQDFAEKMAAIYAKEQKQLSLVRKDSLREKPVLSNEQSNRVMNAIQENANKERSTLIWNNFTGSEYYKQMFDDLDNYSTKALENLREHLLRVREEAGNLNPQDLKAYIDALNKLEEKLGDRKPFKSLDLAMSRYQDYKGVPEENREPMNPFQTMLAAAKAYRDLNKDINSLTEKQGELLRSNAVRYEAMQKAIKEAKAAQENLNNAYEKAAKNIGLRKNNDGSYSNARGETVATKTTELKNITVIGENKGVKDAERIYKEKADSAAFATNEYEKSNNALEKNTKYLSDAEATQHNISKAVQQTINRIVEWGDAVASVAGNLGSMFDTLGNSGLADVMSEIQGIATGASNIGKAMASFATDNPLGGITGTVSGITGIISSIAQAHDKKLDRAIERSQVRVERLKNDYLALQRVIDRQLGAQTEQQTSSQIDSLKKQRAELQYQMRAEDAKKKTDQGKMEDYRNSIAELDDQIKYYTTDLAKSLYDIDIKSWASEFGDALFEAWQKGENGADAFRKKTNEIMGQLANDVLKKGIMEKALQKVNDYLFGSDGKGGVFADGVLSEDEIAGAAGAFMDAQNSVTDYFSALDRINEEMKSKYGVDMKQTDNNDTSLKAGIKNITEETADLLAAYLNAVRADVSIIRSMEASWNEKLNAMADIFRQVNFLEMSKNATIQTGYLQQIAENSQLLLDVSTESRNAVVAVNDLMRQVSNGAKSLTVKVK